MSTVGGGVNIITDGLVLYLDAANTKSIVSGSTTWRDLSRSGNNVTLTNVPTFNADKGGSIVFDGVNDNVVLPNNSEFYLTPNKNQTNCGWFKTNITNTSTIIYDARNTTTINASGYFVGVQNTGVLRARFYYNQPGSPSIQVNTPIQQNIWYHYSVVLDRSGLMSLYLNGLLKSSASIASFANNNLSINTNPTIAIRSYSGSAILPFNGNISQVKIYNRDLTPQEILQNYNATKGRFGL
jgi:hypothetical protein